MGDSKVLAECVEKVIREYELSGHTVDNISKDALSAYQTEHFDTSVAEEGASNTESIPYEHSQNYTERFIQTLGEDVSSIIAGAPYVPEKLNAFAVQLAIVIWNGQEGHIEGMSRLEQFKHERPSALKNGIAGAYGDCFVVNQVKEQWKGGKFSDAVVNSAHGILAMYLCPNTKTADGHLIYNWESGKVLSRRSYERVPSIPPSWNKLNMSIPEVFDEDGTLYDFINGPEGYDVTHLGASEGAIIALNSNNDINTNINTNITDTAVKIVAETGPTDTTLIC
jgi:hypothetical protein